MYKYCFYATVLILSALFSSCHKDESFKCAVTYDVRLPENLSNLVDAYVEFNDNGETSREIIKDGRFQKSFSYQWDDKQALNTQMGFSTMKIFMYSKVESSDLKEGTQLLKDPKAFFEMEGFYSYSKDKNNLGDITSTSSIGNFGNGKYVWAEKVQNYSYTIQEQINYLRSLENDPYISVTLDKIGASLTIKAECNVGQNDEGRASFIKSK